MKPVLSREQMRAFDAAAISGARVPSVVLMENAGRGAAEAILRELEARGERRPTVVVCGPGNNGGDGFVIARQLATRGFGVRTLLIGNVTKLKGDARLNAQALSGLGNIIQELQDSADMSELEAALAGAGCVVDALFGTGLDRDVTGLFEEVIARINGVRRFTCAVDIPSGIDSNTGSVLGIAVRADLTVTFAHYKLGLLTGLAAPMVGRSEVVHIGVPPELHRQVGHSAELVEERDVARHFVARSPNAHKASAGRVVAVAGSAGKTGAALLVARGALRAGAGLVTLAAFEQTREALDRRVLEEMTARIDEHDVVGSLARIFDQADAVAVGPGVGLDERAKELVSAVVNTFHGVIVMDADALTHFAGRLDELKRAPGKLILTPHPGEMGRLLGISTREVEADRYGAVARAVEASGAVVLLKGPYTLIGAAGRVPAISASGTPALATAGAGDVLTGVTSALACTLAPFDAACAAAYVHGAAGAAWAARRGADRGLLSHEIAEHVPEVLGKLGLASLCQNNLRN